MRHGNKLKTLGREASHRKAMLNNLATSILFKGLSDEQMNRQVRTTTKKAKAVRGLVDRLITYAKKGDLTAKRNAAKFVKSKDAFVGLFGVLGDRYKERAGGYTRILKLSSNRHGDNAEMAIITLVEDELVQKKKKRSGKKKSANVKAKKLATTTEAAEAAEAEEVSAEDVTDSNTAAAVSAEPAEEQKKEATVKEEIPAEESPVEKAEAPAEEKKADEAKPEAKKEDEPPKE